MGNAAMGVKARFHRQVIRGTGHQGLRRSAWGRGYAAEGALALVAGALGATGFGRIRAQTMAIKLGSQRVLEKAGFRHVETRFMPSAHPVPGDEQSAVVHEIWRDQLSSRHAYRNPCRPTTRRK
jgi:RimJ/RimL family protein N-acetyltransferase